MKIAVGFSGGVDSTMVALLLKQQGHDVVGITMSLWDPSFNIPLNGSKGCFGPEESKTLAVTQKTAEKLGIRHLIIPLAKQYKQSVIDYFRDEYKAGRTPNPCVKCNELMKFGFLLSSAKEMGIDFDYFATGHYARFSEEGHHLRTAVDQTKDQTYFLSRLKKEQLKKVLFPLGNWKKEDVKKLALDNGFEETAHPSNYGSLDMVEIMKALHKNNFDGYIRPDHGRMIWGEVAMPGYGLYDRALGATYLNGLWEAIEKSDCK